MNGHSDRSKITGRRSEIANPAGPLLDRGQVEFALDGTPAVTLLLRD